jgi:3-dehydroquinate synthase
MHRIDLGVAGAAYPIFIGHGILDELGARCRELELGRQVALVSDEIVAERYLEPVAASLRQAGFQVLEVVYAGGEGAKNLQGAEEIFARMIAAEFDRGAWVAALGGGVVGDMAGFVAATYLRGVPYVQIPTTIVAQVDSSIGGKTGVNHALGKNLIGAFHQPRLVLADTDALRSLPRRELVAGLAEVVKHALIRDGELFSFLEDCIEEIVAMELDPETLDWLIARNVGIKAQVVEADEKEHGLRAILNYGHTIGHAIEAATDYGRYRHGEAVILGLIGAGEIARRVGLWPEEERRRQDALLERLGVPGGLAEVGAERILERTKADKKRVNGQARFVLGRRIGEVEIVEGVEDEVVRSGIEYVQQRY